MFLGNDPNFIAYKSKLKLYSKETQQKYRALICFLFFAMPSTQNSTFLLLCKFISSMSHEKKESVKNFLKSSRPFLLFVVGGLLDNQKTQLFVSPHSIYIRTVRPQLLFQLRYSYSRNRALINQSINQFKPVLQSRQQALKVS